ncbi:diaminopimelate epimerase [Helicobacter suis]|uniref:diaminopimelate epimerase n=1 Tax=Helicobacter suis TaxID=104628 RepID=UPI0013D2948D|nr:diaminopimelate epimerase [Helicobacter suis]
MHLYKYCASGNDFLITSQFKSGGYSALAKQVCHRHYGFGADGLVVLLPHSELAYTWEFYNADGSEASMCGNASRCAGFYAYKQGLAPCQHAFLSKAGIIQVEVQSLSQTLAIVESNLGIPKWLQTLNLEGKTWYLLDTGVPHLVHFVPSLKQIPSTKIALMQTLRERFNANVNIACIIDDHTIYLATYERGVEDITLACGTGMAAVFMAAYQEYHLMPQATLIPPSQEKLSLCLKDNEVYFKGRVEYVGMVLGALA